MMRAFRDREIRRLMAALLFAPLVIYAFFSAHTMPRFTDQGVEIVICTADGFDLGLSDSDTDPQPTPCNWSMQIHAAALPAPGPALDAAPLARVQAAALETSLLRSGRIESANQARAPPLLL
ncbi:MAG: hypothetical protein Q8K28_21745 [Hoeflea sp.]|uniref:hypothetical protein n=1 Tax=Hoeflea sp. TaxID=1940281 RepID=UPI0027303E12|nr:hypothetical protein [Hoeflea sp.]MDP2122534.1 hypothetical protein [Hoeflea sp.]